MTAHAIASKFRRALRNGTGANFSHEQLRELGACGVLELLARLENEELCPATKKPSPSEITGLPSGVTGSRQRYGRSRDIANDHGPLSIAALSEGL